jgi:hypothetical protein
MREDVACTLSRFTDQRALSGDELNPLWRVWQV